ncbi:MAG TPA: 50S ribosomal protein L35 [Thermodesulfobacteriota bacterium]
MPKLKSNRGVVKRLKATGGGKIRRRRVGKSHLLTGEARGGKRKKRLPALVSKADQKRIMQLAPYLDKMN